MDTELEAAAQCRSCDALNVRRLRHEKAGVPGLVGIRCEEGRSARSECSIGVELDAANPDSSIGQGGLGTACEIVRDIGAVVRYEDVVAEIVSAFAREIFVDVDKIGRASCRERMMIS